MPHEAAEAYRQYVGERRAPVLQNGSQGFGTVALRRFLTNRSHAVVSRCSVLNRQLLLMASEEHNVSLSAEGEKGGIAFTCLKKGGTTACPLPLSARVARGD